LNVLAKPPKEKRADNRFWRKVKCLNREEFVVVGWTDPEGSRPHLGALLLAYYAPHGRLVYAGRAGTGMNTDQLRRLRERLEPLATTEMPLHVRPPKGTRFGSPLVLSRVHWVQPEMVVEVTYLTWTDDNLLRHVVFDGVREDKPARGVVSPHPEKVEARNKRLPGSRAEWLDSDSVKSDLTVPARAGERSSRGKVKRESE
jgi:ATP-dependent DNA ligase